MPSGIEYVTVRATWSDGRETAVRSVPIRYYSINHGSAMKRKKPPLLISNGTALSRSRQFIYDQIVEYRPPRPATSPFVAVSQATTSEHYSLGQGVDKVRYDTTLEAIVLNKLRSKLRNRSVNLANMLGEYKQATRLFASGAASVAIMTLAALKRDPRILYKGYLNPYGKLRKGQTGYSALADIPKDVSKAWLGYVYGVKPLMSDMHDAMTELKTRTDRNVFRIKVRASSSIDQLQQGLYNSLLNGPSVKCSVAEYSRKTVFGVAEVKMRSDLLNSTLGAYGFTNPLGVAWELTPYSFVIDWWINVGEVLESLDNALYFDGAIWAQLTEKYSYRRTVECLGGAGLYTNDTYSRRSPQIVSSIADFRLKTKPSLMHVANGLALLTSLLRR